MRDWIEPVLQLAREAGAAIMHVYAQDFLVEHKDDLSPLTAADMAAHHLIVAGLTELTPGIPVLSEESAGSIGPNARHGNGIGWWTRSMVPANSSRRTASLPSTSL